MKAEKDPFYFPTMFLTRSITGKLSRRRKKQAKKCQAHLFILKNGKPRPLGFGPAALLKWTLHMEDPRNKVHFVEQVEGLTISTTFLGINHRNNFFAFLPPLLFETAILTPERCKIVGRYTTAKKAARGHRQAVAEVRRLLHEKRGA